MTTSEPADDRTEQAREERGFRPTGSDKPQRPYALRRPCGNCPFRKDVEFYLHPERAQEIADSLRNDQPFNCHGTLDYSDEAGPQVSDVTNFCAGALGTVERGGDRGANLPMKLALALGVYRPDLLQQDMPVFDSLDEWVVHMRDLDARGRHPRPATEPDAH